jgi:hypothetical protein
MIAFRQQVFNSLFNLLLKTVLKTLAVIIKGTLYPLHRNQFLSVTKLKFFLVQQFFKNAAEVKDDATPPVPYSGTR